MPLSAEHGEVALDRILLSDAECPLQRLAERLQRLTPNDLVRVTGAVVEIAEGRISVAGLSNIVKLGEQVVISTEQGPMAGVVGIIRSEVIVVMPYDRIKGPHVGDRVHATGTLHLAPHPSWKGRVVDALGSAIDEGNPLIHGTHNVPVDRRAPNALSRAPVGKRIATGVTAIDIFTPLLAGQRIGIFAGSGVGKSTLLAMLSRSPQADLVVVALIGERGREVREFIYETLGPWRNSVIAVVATGDDSTAMRRLAPRTAMAIAEYFRDCGKNVLVIMDSLTRFAHAQREHALAAGELPVARGYPPSVFRELAALLERAGPGENQVGTITLMATVLVDGDDHNDPIADAVRGIVDGHLVLDRSIAATGRWPALNIISSISRLANRAWTPEQARLVHEARSLIARFEETKDLRSLGEYRPSVDPLLDRAVAFVPKIYSALHQRVEDPITADPFVLLRRCLEPSQERHVR